MEFSLGSTARAGGYRLVSFDTIGSTNSEALERARAGDPGGLWVVAREQTEGRGRRGRKWETPGGNLAATHLTILDDEAARHAATLGFVAGLALHQALTGLAPEARLAIGLDGGSDSSPASRFELKWPNDLLAGGAKLAGILLESERLDSGRIAVAIGIGANIATAPDGLPYAATSLAGIGCTASPEAVFMRLGESWAEIERIWESGRGLPEIRRRWLARAAGLGGPVVVRIGARVLRGRFESIDEAGHLVVRGADGSAETIAAAEVHFAAVASATADG